MSAHDEAREDLRATTDAAAHDAERLAAIERVKGGLDPDDPEVVRLSTEASELSARLSRTVRAEAEIAADLESS